MGQGRQARGEGLAAGVGDEWERPSQFPGRPPPGLTLDT